MTSSVGIFIILLTLGLVFFGMSVVTRRKVAEALEMVGSPSDVLSRMQHGRAPIIAADDNFETPQGEPEIEVIAEQSAEDAALERALNATKTDTEPKAPKAKPTPRKPATKAANKTAGTVKTNYSLPPDLKKRLAEEAAKQDCWQVEYAIAALTEFATQMPPLTQSRNGRNRNPGPKLSSTFEFPQATHELLQQTAKRTNRTNSDVLRMALSRALDTNLKIDLSPAPDDWS